MGRKKGSLNKKTIERLMQQGILNDVNNETSVNTGISDNIASETQVNTDVSQDVASEISVNTGNSETQDTETQEKRDVSETSIDESTINTGVSEDTDNETSEKTGSSDEQSLLDDFLKFKEKKDSEEQFTDNEGFNEDFDEDFSEFNKTKEYLPIEKQLIILDNIIVFILNTFFKQDIEKMTSEDVEFISQLAGSEQINLLPSGKNMFYLGLAAYYFSKINFKSIFK